MGKWLIASAASAAAVALVAGGTLDQGRLYNLSLPEARQRLATLAAPDATVMINGVGPDAIERSVSKREVRWRVRGDGGAATLYVAELVPLGAAQTRVRLRVQHDGISVHERITSTRFLRGFGTASFAEAIYAALEQEAGRRLDPVRDWAFQASRDPDQMRELGQAITSMYADLPRQFQENGKASGRSTRARMEAATRPMINPMPIEQPQE